MGERMKSFWLSLLFFILLLCSCKTKEVGCEVDFTTKEKIETNYTKYQVIVDTSNVLKIGIDKSKLTITEHIIITKYDKDTGAVTEETEEKRTIRQDTKTNTQESENRGITEVDNGSIHQSIHSEKQEKVQEEIKEESAISTFAQYLGKWLGIGIVAMLFCWLIWQGIKKNILHL